MPTLVPVIRLFGPLAIEDGERVLGPRDLGGARPKQVLEILLAARGHRVPTDRLAELIWGADTPDNVTGSLQTFVSMLRRHLTPDRERARKLVVTEPEAYRFAPELVSLDLDRFDALLQSSAHEPTSVARASLEQALELVRGEILEDEPYATWALDLRDTYQGRILGAHLDAADAALAERDLAAALAHAESSARIDPFSERAQRTAMLALHALGRSQEALARYRRFRTRLDDELGLEPGPDTRATEGAIIRREDVRALLPRPIRAMGARTGGGGRTRLLGRTEELDALAAAVEEGLEGSAALIQIVGDAGIGKTRMLDELQAELAGVRVGRADCSALEGHLPYVPLASALRMALADVALDDARLAPLGGILPELALGEAQRFGEVEALEAAVAAIAEHGPIVLLLDDVHLADAETLAALGYLRRRAQSHRFVVVATAPPGEMFPGRRLAGLAVDRAIRLEPLAASDLAPLGIDGLHETTGGNPRFVAEALANDRRPERSETLTEALIAQCRAEGESAFRLLAAASMLPQPFEPEPVAEVLGTAPDRLIEELERLCEQRILRVDGVRFRFRYDLVRRAVLSSISPARRRLMCRRLNCSETASRPAAQTAAVSEAG
jgi:DNA-binding SARP family transcriptional activator